MEIVKLCFNSIIDGSVAVWVKEVRLRYVQF